MKWNDKRPEENYVEKILMTGGEEMKKLAKEVEKEMPVDKIDLSTAFELPHWQIIWASEPSRQVDVRMAYGDLMGIYTKFTKYRWHDLRKNPEDLPEYGKRILFQIDITKIDNGSFDVIEESEEQNVYSGSYEEYLDYFCNDDYEGYATQHSYEADCVIAWKYIDSYEVEE